MHSLQWQWKTHCSTSADDLAMTVPSTRSAICASYSGYRRRSEALRFDGSASRLQDLTAAGTCTTKEKELHVNILEMKAVQLVLEAFKDRIISHEQQCHNGGKSK